MWEMHTDIFGHQVCNLLSNGLGTKMFFVLYLQLFSKFRIVILKKKARKEVIFTEQSANFPQMQGWSYGVVPRRAALRRDAGSWGEGGIWRGRQRGLERLDWRSVL